MINTLKMGLKLLPRDSLDGGFILIEVVGHFFRIRQVDLDTSEDVSSPHGVDGLRVYELDEDPIHVHNRVVRVPTLLGFLVLLLNGQPSYCFGWHFLKGCQVLVERGDLVLVHDVEKVLFIS